MARYKHLMFVCTHQRPDDNPKGCCDSKGSRELLSRLKALVAEHGLKGKVRVTSSGCLNYCARGCAAVIFSERKQEGEPKETWFTEVGPGDAEEIFNKYLKRLD